jgi:cbb3-type cytochrome oxidase maturation protein
MSAIYLLIFFSLIIAIGFLAAFYYSVKNGQYEDTDSPAVRMLLDDSKPKNKEASTKPKGLSNKDFATRDKGHEEG